MNFSSMSDSSRTVKKSMLQTRRAYISAENAERELGVDHTILEQALPSLKHSALHGSHPRTKPKSKTGAKNHTCHKRQRFVPVTRVEFRDDHLLPAHSRNSVVVRKVLDSQ